MAFRNIFGFETGNLLEASFTGGSGVSVQSTTKRTGTYALRLNPAASASYYQTEGLAATGGTTLLVDASLYCTTYVRFATLPSANGAPIFRTHRWLGTEIIIEVRVDTNGDCYIHNGTSASSVAGTLLADTWHRIDVKSVQSAGTCELIVDGGSAVTLASGNFLHGYAVLGVRTGTATYDAYFDDFASDSSQYPGAGEVRLLTPDGNGTYTDWATGTGSSDYLEVVEVPHDGDTTYIGSSTSGHVETVTLISSATAGLQNTIDVVKALSVSRRTGGVNNNAQLRLRSGTTDTDTTSADSTASYVLRAKLFETDPNTSAAWTSSGVDGIEVGIEINAAQASRCTWLGASVWSHNVAAGGAAAFRRPLLGVGV